MASYNKWTGLGRLGHDAEVRATRAGAEVMQFSMATDYTWRDSDNEIHHETEWHRIVFWARGAKKKHGKLRRYMVKGREVMVVGRIRTHEWEADGEKRYRKEIIAETVNLTGVRRDAGLDADEAGTEQPARPRRPRRNRRGARNEERRPERSTAPPEPPDPDLKDLDDFPI